MSDLRAPENGRERPQAGRRERAAAHLHLSLSKDARSDSIEGRAPRLRDGETASGLQDATHWFEPIAGVQQDRPFQAHQRRARLWAHEDPRTPGLGGSRRASAVTHLVGWLI